MKKDEIIALLQQQNSFLQEQLQEANRKADALLEEVTSLRKLHRYYPKVYDVGWQQAFRNSVKDVIQDSKTIGCKPK